MQEKILQIDHQIKKLEPLVEQLTKAKNVYEKLSIITSQPDVNEFLQKNKFLKSYLKNLPAEVQLVAKAIIAIGQGEVVFYIPDSLDHHIEDFQQLLYQLQDVEKFYDSIGGIVGYHLIVLKLIEDAEQGHKLPTQEINYIKPCGLSIDEESSEVKQAIIDGITNLKHIGEMYPVGGAGDRLKLREDHTEVLLPAACLQFCGRSLLEGLIRDVQAREYLYYKIFGAQTTIPIALMTSHEKNNHFQIFDMCEKNYWFGRPNRSFFLFIQPLAPVITKEGNWSCREPLKLTLKPGGHGVIWKLALDNGVLDWFKDKQRNKIIVRQINNPIGGTDSNLLALAGVGFAKDKLFGFASCPSLPNATEGVDVLKEIKEHGFSYCISNVEYTEFSKHNIASHLDPSNFPANTNILFADVDAISKAAQNNPIPGMLVNMKSKATYIDSQGVKHEVTACRLESTMQNIADSFKNHYERKITKKELHNLHTFINYNKRSKTISVTKRSYNKGASPEETPEAAFYQLISNNRDLFVDAGFQIPKLNSLNEYLEEGPTSLILYHPALGPLYSTIKQKIHNGRFEKHSECQLEIADIEINDLKLQGSLLVFADAVLGKKDSQNVLKYSEFTGKCELNQVSIINEGIDRKAENIFWKNRIERKESLTIIIRGSGEFYAEGITFLGDQTIEVPNGCRMIAHTKNGSIKLHCESIENPSWYWKYDIDNQKNIRLKKWKR